ncbi:hypothetical protein [Winslowiella iniecta]|uniref:Uncharacterized protein n=1 Tax=Winslowiella iniecta TaxID=1560201 RepID=A0A0L7SYA0_9GAMM|nr:hypothetical protein [Winslowiella iniecta]KOC87532.1 hypothetical protein NG42_20235 [Winslowiella iniecta]KOC88107.1 hypothetical protein NG43_20800 [Winslowiella iniecta]
MKDAIIKKAMPDGKVAITMFADPEVANEIVRLAKEAAIEVIDAGKIETVSKSSPVERVAEIAKALQTKQTTIKPTAISSLDALFSSMD